MKKKIIYIMLILCVALCSCTNNKQGENAKNTEDNNLTIDSIENTENTNLVDEEIDNEPSFAELIANVKPISLPFGSADLKIIKTDEPLKTRINDWYTYDKDNHYKLNDYFSIHRELDPFVEHDGTNIRTRDLNYFSARLPDLPTGEIVLLYYAVDSTTMRVNAQDKSGMYYMKEVPGKYEFEENWILVVCKPNGTVVYADNYLVASEHIRAISYIDENYVIHTKLFNAPRYAKRISGTPLGDDVSDEIRSEKRTILYSETVYKLRRPKKESPFSNKNRWYIDGETYSRRYVWVNNEPSEIESYGNESLSDYITIGRKNDTKIELE